MDFQTLCKCFELLIVLHSLCDSIVENGYCLIKW